MRVKWHLAAPFLAILGLIAGAPVQAEPRFGSISGRVRDEDEGPIAGATVRLHPFNDPFSGRPGQWQAAIAEVRTDRHGGYHFSDSDGSLFSTALKRMFMVAVACDGHAHGFKKVILDQGHDAMVDLVLSRPASVTIRVRDKTGASVPGASLRRLNVYGKNGEFDPRRDDFEVLGLLLESSDKEGLLRLPELPQGASVDAMIEHSELAAIEVKQIAVTSGNVVDATMNSGVPVILKIAPSGQGAAPSDVVVLMLRERFGAGHPSTMWFERLSFDEVLAARFTAEAGAYSILRLLHENFYITHADASTVGPLHIALSNDNCFTFQAHQKVRARGRVVDAATGGPVPGANVEGEIASRISKEESDRSNNEWSYVSSVRTDDRGNYAISLATGPVRLMASGDGYIAEGGYVETFVAPDGSTVIPELKIRRLPKVAGTVRDPEGRPVAKAIVRLQGKMCAIQPVVTNEHGEFELTLPWLRYDSETSKPLVVQPLVAFHPLKSLSTRVDVKLDEPNAISNLVLTLKSEACSTLLPCDPRHSPAKTDAAAALATELGVESLLGKPAPELDGLIWLNTPRKSMRLTDFRGNYVLLGFWQTSCGPCHAAFPTIKLLHQFYKDRGLTVVGVHDNSAASEVVREHVKRLELDYSIVIDTPDGRIMSRYKPHGVRAFPSYFLIGPDGNVLYHDAIDPESQLSSYMLEIVRALLVSE